jgi:hypothetical protein
MLPGVPNGEGREGHAVKPHWTALGRVAFLSTYCNELVGKLCVIFALGCPPGQPAAEGGAAYRTRTCDPLITNEVLYQLS